MGFFDAVITIFLQRHHSKEICDRFFGHIEEAFAENGVFGVPSLLSMIERITSNTTSGAKLRGRSVNPMATSRLKDFFARIFNQGTTGANMPDKDYHIHVVAGPGVKNDMQGFRGCSCMNRTAAATTTRTLQSTFTTFSATESGSHRKGGLRASIRQVHCE